MLPTPEEIKQTEPRTRPLPVEPWVAANLSRLWQSMKKNIQASIASTASGTQEQPRSVQSTPASVRSHS